MTELCAIYEITRETGYYWLRRYQQGGLEALSDRHRAPRQHPNQTPEEIAAAVLELRRAHMSWGPRKLKRVLEREEPQRPWPAASTIGTLVAREGLVVARRKRRRVAPYTQPFASADAPNRVWCADFKGWFRTADGERIDPLTITTLAAAIYCAANAWRRRTRARAGDLRGGVSRMRAARGHAHR